MIPRIIPFSHDGEEFGSGGGIGKLFESAGVFSPEIGRKKSVDLPCNADFSMEGGIRQAHGCSIDDADMDSVETTVHTAGRIQEEDLEAKQRQVVEVSGRLGIISRPFPSAFRTDWPSPFSRKKLDHHRLFPFNLLEKEIPKNKGLETDKAIQYSFNKH